MLDRRAVSAVAIVAFALVAVVGGVAFACTNFVRIDSLVPASESPVATASVKGSGAAAGATVELRWNGVKGPVIGTAKADEAGAFSAQASIPDAPAGIYFVVATDGRTLSRAAFEVPATSGLVGPTRDASELLSVASSEAFPLSLGLGALAVGLAAFAVVFGGLATRRRSRVSVGRSASARQVRPGCFAHLNAGSPS